MNAAWRRGRWRWLVAALGGIAIAGALLTRYQGLVFPVRVASGSMAEGLLGPHRELTCDDCGFPFACDAQAEIPWQQATCPNCGFGSIALRDEQLRPGQCVLIDRWAYWTREPKRGDVVAFRDPIASTELAVKRIVGLPHESIAIRGGELFINGNLYRKTLDESRATAVLVYDDAFHPQLTSGLPPRWSVDGGPDAWLTYHHWPCYAAPRSRTTAAPVTDNDGYNQGVSRRLYEMTDVWLSCRLQVQRDDFDWWLRIHDGREEFQCRVSPRRGLAELLRGGSEISAGTFAKTPRATPASVQFGILDQQVFLVLDQQVVIWHPYEPASLTSQPTATPLDISASAAITVTQLQVFRDIYYLDKHRSSAEWATAGPLGADEYLLIGDNVPVSTDSRHWPRPGLPRSALLGRVMSHGGRA